MVNFSDDCSLLVKFLLVTFLWLFHGPRLWKNSVCAFFVLFCGFLVALVLGKLYACLSWKSLLNFKRASFCTRFGRRKAEQKQQGKILYTELLNSWSILSCFLPTPHPFGRCIGLPCSAPLTTRKSTECKTPDGKQVRVPPFPLLPFIISDFSIGMLIVHPTSLNLT